MKIKIICPVCLKPATFSHTERLVVDNDERRLADVVVYECKVDKELFPMNLSFSLGYVPIIDQVKYAEKPWTKTHE